MTGFPTVQSRVLRNYYIARIQMPSSNGGLLTSCKIDICSLCSLKRHLIFCQIFLGRSVFIFWAKKIKQHSPIELCVKKSDLKIWFICFLVNDYPGTFIWISCKYRGCRLRSGSGFFVDIIWLYWKKSLKYSGMDCWPSEFYFTGILMLRKYIFITM